MEIARTIPSRNTDPATSHKSAEAVQVRANTQRAYMLMAFSAFGAPCTDDEAAETSPLLSMDSCYWKRAGELREGGYLEWVRDARGEVVERMGRLGQPRGVSRLTPQGVALAERLHALPVKPKKRRATRFEQAEARVRMLTSYLDKTDPNWRQKVRTVLDPNRT